MASTSFTAIGNMTGDPELRFSASGTAWVKFTIALSDRKFNKETNSWEDGKTLFLRCRAFKQLAEHIAETFSKGSRAMATGHLEQNTWENADGVKQTSIDMIIEEIAPSLKFATAKMQGATRSHGTSDATDPWASTANQNVPF